MLTARPPPLPPQDKSGGAKGADQAFIRVGEAFERLRDGSGRAAYGAELAREPAGSLLRRQKSAERFTEEAEHLRRELRRWKEEWAQGSSLGTPGSAQRKAAFGRSGSGERAGSLPHELLAGAIFTVRERGRAGEPPQESSVWLSGDGVTLNWRSVNSAGHRPDGFWDLRTLTAVTRLKPGPGQGDLPVSLSLTRKDGSVHVLTAEHSDVCASWHKALKSLLAPPSAT